MNHEINAQTSPFSVQIQAQLIANYASQHLKAAALFRDNVVRLELTHANDAFGNFFEEIRSYGSACIMSGTASLEALINELFMAHSSDLRAKLNNFDSDFWGKKGIERKSCLRKYQIALKKLNRSPFEEDKNPYRDADYLIKLRNTLIHYRPTWDLEDERIKLSKDLAGKFELSPFIGDGSDFVSMKCMSAGCVRWVIDTIRAFVDEFNARTHLDDKKMVAFLFSATQT